MRGELALLLPFSILARGLLRLTYARTTGEGDFRGLGRTILIQSLVQPVALLILVLWQVDDVLCFAFADIIGHGSGVAYLLWRQRKHLRGLLRGWSMAAILGAAQTWQSLPLYNLPGSFFSLAFIMSPLLITPMAADPVFAGHTALAYRIFDVPTQILAAASAPIFLNLRPSIERRTPIFGRSTLLGLILLVGAAYAAMAGLLMLADPYLGQTALAGLTDVIPVIAIFHIFVALANPLNDSCALYPQQRRLVLIQGLALCGSAVAALLAVTLSPAIALATLAIVAGARMLAMGELLRALSGISHRTFTQVRD
jgi:hypothetical protein